MPTGKKKNHHPNGWDATNINTGLSMWQEDKLNKIPRKMYIDTSNLLQGKYLNSVYEQLAVQRGSLVL